MRRLMPIVLLAVVLTGCKVKVDQGFELNSDGSGKASVVFAFDEELAEMMSSFSPGDDPVAQMESDMPVGWSSSDWSEGEFTGIEASTDFADLAELRSIAISTFSGENGFFETFLIEDTGSGGFRFEATMSGENLEEGLQGVEGFDMSGSIDDLSATFFDAEIIVKLPGEVVSHNADHLQSDGTLVWDVGLADSGRMIRAESAPGGGLPLVPIAAVGALLLVVAAGVVRHRQRSGGSVIADDHSFVEPVPVPVGRPVDGDPFA